MMPTPGIKEQARKRADSLPDDATWEDLEYKIFVRRKIESGAASIESEETLSTEEVLDELGSEDA